MRNTSSSWLASAGRLFGLQGSPASGRRTRKRSSTRRCILESLENRAVFSADLDFAIGVGSTGKDVSLDVATDHVGNTYTTGYYSGTIDFDPANVHVDNSDVQSAGDTQAVHITKRGPNGDFLWARTLPGADMRANTGVSVATDANGNVVVAGYFYGSLTVEGVTLTSAGNSMDAFVAKFDPNGTAVWAKQMGSTSDEWFLGVSVDGNGNVIAVGDNVSYGPGLVYKYDASGSVLWSKPIGNSANGGSTRDVATDQNGNIYIAGLFDGTVDFDPGTKTKYVTGGPGGTDGFVLKLTSAGNFSWVSPFLNQTTTSTCIVHDVNVDAIGNVVVAGSYSGKVDFNPGRGTTNLPLNGSTTFGFVEKLNANGSLAWVQQVGSKVNALTFDATGGIYLVGDLNGQADFDPGTGSTLLTSNGSRDVFVAKYTSSGSFAWAISFGGTGNDYAPGIDMDSAGNLYIAGGYFSSVDFDPDPLSDSLLTSAGSADMFLLKLKNLS